MTDDRPRCAVCGLRIEHWMNFDSLAARHSEREWLHLATVAGKEQEADHQATPA